MAWAEHAMSRLDEAGYKSGAARRQVVELLGGEHCAVTALEVDRRLAAVGRATVYRTLEQLERLRLVQRVDIGVAAAGYERLDPGEHHHHFVCEDCGRLAHFSSEELEKAIEAIGRRAEFTVAAHDVVLRGSCAGCSGQRA